MLEIGYKLCSEEQSPEELIHCAHLAEEAGFDFAMISDHFHPWVDKQGHSSFVWAVLGGIVGFMLLALYLPIFNLGNVL